MIVSLTNSQLRINIPSVRYDDLFDKINGATFSNMDLKSSYHQLRVRDSYILTAAFRAWYGLYKFVVMYFVQTNAPSSF